ncbi:N-acetyltransferase family protein [Saccharothrix sp. S26]|uniref:GNAT family N-acetyltransferase n=1 Tax=Saccharothrix sp. S26 TaxID=2907215 RepID=UPI001F2B6840|nr:GNAT family N-acetyltransferase [Saccharothrix sp. S26]MCE6999108.1 N-acetyltransferase family protein [Saccharothrix sp. S26]
MSPIVERRVVEVRDAWPADLGAVTRIFATYVENTVVSLADTPPSRADWGRRYWDAAARGLPFLVAEEDGRVVGMAYCSPWRGKGGYRFTAESSIYLEPSATGRGTGRRLLRELLDRCERAGVREVIAVIVDPGGEGSAKLHESCGYTTVGRLTGVGHKHGTVVDTVLMQHRTGSTGRAGAMADPTRRTAGAVTG